MSSSPNAQSPTSARAVPLGRLLIMRGLLTEQQLIEGLLEQDRTGDKLGKVLIRLGFVDPSSVALALASQHGGPLKTEYGFAIGFDAPTEPVTVPPLRSVPRPPSQPADGVVASERSTATEPPSQIDTMIAEPEAAQAEL